MPSPGPLTAEVRRHGGLPCLFLDGRPHDGLCHWHHKPAGAELDIEGFSGAGIDLFTTGNGLDYNDAGELDLDRSLTKIDRLVSRHPQLRLLLRVRLGMPPGWFGEGSGRSQLHRDARTGTEIRGELDGESLFNLFSDEWAGWIREKLPRYVEAVEASFGASVYGYHLAAGATGEWAHRWGDVLSGYGPVEADAFRQFLESRYGNEAKVAAAWNRPGLTFADAAMPQERCWDRMAWPPVSLILDPSRDRCLLDAHDFLSETVADRILEFAAIAKETLRRLGRQKLVGVFYGYQFSATGTHSVMLNGGHLAAGRVLRSPDIDFLSAPLNYNDRAPGGTLLSRLFPGSLALHGKLYYLEDDTFTHLAEPTPWRYGCRDARETANLLWRNFATCQREGGTLWFMDHDGDGWYRDPSLLSEIATMREDARRRLDGPRDFPAPIAVFGSEQSLRLLRHDPVLVESFWSDFLSQLSGVGHAFDLFHIEDLEALRASSRMDGYRLAIFPLMLRRSAAERAELRRWSETFPGTVVWFYAAGLATDGGLDEASMEELTGFRLRCLHSESFSLTAESVLTGQAMTYGSARHACPRVEGVDAKADLLGWWPQSGGQALLRRFTDCGRVYWSGAPALNAELLRWIAREAGICLLTENGDPVYPLGDRVVRHCKGAALPQAEAWSRLVTVSDSNSPAQRGETLVSS